MAGRQLWALSPWLRGVVGEWARGSGSVRGKICLCPRWARETPGTLQQQVQSASVRTGVLVPAHAVILCQCVPRECKQCSLCWHATARFRHVPDSTAAGRCLRRNGVPDTWYVPCPRQLPKSSAMRAPLASNSCRNFSSPRIWTGARALDFISLGCGDGRRDVCCVCHRVRACMHAPGSGSPPRRIAPLRQSPSHCRRPACSNGVIDRDELRNLLSTLEGGKATTLMVIDRFVVDDDVDSAMARCAPQARLTPPSSPASSRTPTAAP